MQESAREPGLDLVRVFASFFVVAVHFYLNCNYYQTSLTGGKMMIKNLIPLKQELHSCD